MIFGPKTRPPYSNYLDDDSNAQILYADLPNGTGIRTKSGSFKVVKGNYTNVRAGTKIEVKTPFSSIIQTINGDDIEAINNNMTSYGESGGGSKQPRKGSTSKCTSTGKKVTFTKDGKKVTRVVHENQRGTKVVKYNDTWILLSKLKI